MHNSGRLLPARPPLPARRRGRGRWGAHACAEQSAEHDARARALVSTDWLQGQLDQEDSGLVLLDVRGQVGKKDVGGGRVETAYEALADDFLAAHIPGAVFVDWTRDIVDLEDDTAPVQLAPLDVFAAAMEEKGVGTDKTVVIYDTGKMLFATRLWWALTIYGHGDVRILNGGWQRWTLEGRDTESDCPTCPLKLYASFDAREAHPAVDCALHIHTDIHTCMHACMHAYRQSQLNSTTIFQSSLIQAFAAQLPHLSPPSCARQNASERSAMRLSLQTPTCLCLLLVCTSPPACMRVCARACS